MVVRISDRQPPVTAPIPGNSRYGVWEPQNQASVRGATSQWLFSRVEPPGQPRQPRGDEGKREVICLHHFLLLLLFFSSVYNSQMIPDSSFRNFRFQIQSLWPGQGGRRGSLRDSRLQNPTWPRSSRQGPGLPSPAKSSAGLPGQTSSRPSWAPPALCLPHPSPPPPLSSPPGSVQAALSCRTVEKNTGQSQTRRFKSQPNHLVAMT